MIASFADALRAVPIAKQSATVCRALRTAAIERYLRIDTGGPYGLDYSPLTRLQDAYSYVPVDYGALWRYMRPLHLSSSDVVFDIGSGMGRVLCMFARRPLSRCIGVERDAELAAAAKRNAVTLRGRRAPIDVRVGDAADADYTEGTIFWMFNPFGKATLQCVMERIERSLRESPRHIQIAYLRPEHEDVLDACLWLRCTGRQTAPLHKSCSAASYWSNRIASRT